MQQALPTEICTLICEYCQICDLQNLALVNNMWNHSSAANCVWKKFVNCNNQNFASYKKVMLGMLQHRFEQDEHVTYHYRLGYSNTQFFWFTIRCATSVTMGQTGRIAFQVEALLQDFPNIWQIVLGVIPSSFIETNVIGYPGDGGYGVAFLSGEFLDNVHKTNLEVIAKNLTLQDVIGLELDWTGNNAVLGIFVNGRKAMSHTIADDNTEWEWSFGVSMIGQHAVRIVPWYELKEN